MSHRVYSALCQMPGHFQLAVSFSFSVPIIPDNTGHLLSANLTPSSITIKNLIKVAGRFLKTEFNQELGAKGPFLRDILGYTVYVSRYSTACHLHILSTTRLRKCYCTCICDSTVAHWVI